MSQLLRCCDWCIADKEAHHGQLVCVDLLFHQHLLVTSLPSIPPSSLCSFPSCVFSASPHPLYPPLLPFQFSKFPSSAPWRRVMHHQGRRGGGRGRRAGFEEVRVRGGGDHLPGGKKASAPFVNSTIGTVSWATGEPCVGGGGGQRRWVREGVERVEDRGGEREREEGWAGRVSRVIHS